MKLVAWRPDGTFLVETSERDGLAIGVMYNPGRDKNQVSPNMQLGSFVAHAGPWHVLPSGIDQTEILAEVGRLVE